MANRTLEHALDLASRVGGSAISLSEIMSAIVRVDMVIGSIHADKPVIEIGEFKKVTRTSPIFFIDLGMPRNFSSALGDLDDVYLYNIDDLATIAEENKAL